MTEDTPTVSHTMMTVPPPELAQPHLPVLLLVDTSSSMRTELGELHAGVTAALDVAWSTLHAPRTSLLGVITVGGTAEVALPLAPPVDPGSLPAFIAEGQADLAGAIDLIVSEMERATTANLARGRRTLTPWIIVLSDGHFARGDAAHAIERLHAPPTQPVVCPMGVGDLDETTLARIGTDLGFAVDTPDDLPEAMTDLMRVIMDVAGSDTPEAVPTVPTPVGTRPLEGW